MHRRITDLRQRRRKYFRLVLLVCPCVHAHAVCTEKVDKFGPNVQDQYAVGLGPNKHPRPGGWLFGQILILYV